MGDRYKYRDLTRLHHVGRTLWPMCAQPSCSQWACLGGAVRILLLHHVCGQWQNTWSKWLCTLAWLWKHFEVRQLDAEQDLCVRMKEGSMSCVLELYAPGMMFVSDQAASASCTVVRMRRLVCEIYQVQKRLTPGVTRVGSDLGLPSIWYRSRCDAHTWPHETYGLLHLICLWPW